VAEALQLWSNKKNYSEAIYIYANATKQLTISTKRWKFQWLSGTLCAKYMLIRGSEGMTPGKVLEFRFSESASAGYPHLSTN